MPCNGIGGLGASTCRYELGVVASGMVVDAMNKLKQTVGSLQDLLL
jgi:hypothetical protein